MAKKAAKPLTGRERKDAAMVRARAIASSGDCTNFSHVLSIVRREDGDDAAFLALKLYCTASEQGELDRLCKEGQAKRRENFWNAKPRRRR